MHVWFALCLRIDLELDLRIDELLRLTRQEKFRYIPEKHILRGQIMEICFFFLFNSSLESNERRSMTIRTHFNQV